MLFSVKKAMSCDSWCVFCGALAIAVRVVISTKKAANLFIGTACSVLSRAISDSLHVRYYIDEQLSIVKKRNYNF